jgi:hypothetical protein
MKMYKKLLRVLGAVLIVVIIGYFIFTGRQV